MSNMIAARIKQAYWRHRLLKKTADNHQQTYSLPAQLLACWQKNRFSKREDCSALDFLVVDIETSSLNARQGEMLSIGWVVIQGNSILLNSARHYVIKNAQSVGQSAAIHNLRDCDLMEGMDAKDVLADFLQAAENRVLVFHHATLDLAFLNQLAKQHIGCPLLLPHIDTLWVEKKRLERSGKILQAGDLTLVNCRSRYHLGQFNAHNALTDALATAELLLAQMRYCKGICRLDYLD